MEGNGMKCWYILVASSWSTLQRGFDWESQTQEWLTGVPYLNTHDTAIPPPLHSSIVRMTKQSINSTACKTDPGWNATSPRPASMPTSGNHSKVGYDDKGMDVVDKLVSGVLSIVYFTYQILCPNDWCSTVEHVDLFTIYLIPSGDCENGRTYHLSQEGCVGWNDFVWFLHETSTE